MSYIDDMNNWLKETNEIITSLNKQFTNNNTNVDNKRAVSISNIEAVRNNKQEDIYIYDNSLTTSIALSIPSIICDLQVNS